MALLMGVRSCGELSQSDSYLPAVSFAGTGPVGEDNARTSNADVDTSEALFA
jgi:hypothetical protein